LLQQLQKAKAEKLSSSLYKRTENVHWRVAAQCTTTEEQEKIVYFRCTALVRSCEAQFSVKPCTERRIFSSVQFSLL